MTGPAQVQADTFYGTGSVPTHQSEISNNNPETDYWDWET
jgi:hypothetical protein